MADFGGPEQAASQSPKVNVGLFVEAIFDGGTERVWSGPFDISWGGNTFIGAGDLLGVSRIPETTELRSNKVDIVLSGIPTTFLTPALTEHYQGRDAFLYYGFLDDEGVLLDDPTLIGGFIMDVMRITETGDTAIISLSLESRLAILDKSSPRRLTFEDQLLNFPGDLGLEFVATSVKPDPGFAKANISGGTSGTAGGRTGPGGFLF